MAEVGAPSCVNRRMLSLSGGRPSAQYSVGDGDSVRRVEVCVVERESDALDGVSAHEVDRVVLCVGLAGMAAERDNVVKAVGEGIKRVSDTESDFTAAPVASVTAAVGVVPSSMPTKRTALLP